jgi:hypothetical protein
MKSVKFVGAVLKEIVISCWGLSEGPLVLEVVQTHRTPAYDQKTLECDVRNKIRATLQEL